MTDDALDPVQKAINDASKIGTTVPDVTAPPPPPVVPTMPEVPPPPPPEVPVTSSVSTAPPVPPTTDTKAADDLVNQLLSNSPAPMPPTPLGDASPTSYVPTPTTPPAAPKKKNIAAILVGLFLFLGVVATGAYFVARPESLADLRGSAEAPTDAVNCKGCSPDGFEWKWKSATQKCSKSAISCGDPVPGGGYVPPPANNSSQATCEAPGAYGIWCSSVDSTGRSYAFCIDSRGTQGCNAAASDRGYVIQQGVVKCTKSGNIWIPDPTMNYSQLTGPGVVGVVDGKSVWTQVNEQCATQEMGSGSFICREGVMGGKVVYTGGACTADNGKSYTGNLGCFCGVIQVDTGTGHISYSSQCGCNPTDRPNPTAPPIQSTPTNTPTNTPIATPTGIPPICQNIKIYKGGIQVSPSTLKAGDEVTLAVKGNLSPTKSHFRINGGNWDETTTKNANNEFTLTYTIPEGVPNFVIEAEVFTDGAWY